MSPCRCGHIDAQHYTACLRCPDDNELHEAATPAAGIDVERDWPAIAKALFKEIPTCTGCDFDHGWDDHVRAVVRDVCARLGASE
jgi:hypothetical protein